MGLEFKPAHVEFEIFQKLMLMWCIAVCVLTYFVIGNISKSWDKINIADRVLVIPLIENVSRFIKNLA